MANLFFKWGNHASLPTSVSSNDVGTLFFTKDEGGLYIGTESGKAPRRIQGVVQYYADLTEFKSNVVPPYSSDVIYYIASENALVKWNGESIGADGSIASGKFTVLNVTASDFNALSNNVNTLASKVGSATDVTNDNTVWEELESLADLIDVASRPDGNTNSVWVQLNKLASDIDALSGGSGNSLSALNEKINQEITDRKAADTAINKSISDLSTSKANAADVYTKTEADNLLKVKANAADVYDKDTADGLLAAKANAADVYTKDEIDDTVEGINTTIGNLSESKADKSTTYTKNEVNTELAKKADKSTTYTKTDVDNLLDNKADKSSVYTTTQIDSKVSGLTNSINTLTTNKADKSYVDTELAKKADTTDFEENGAYSTWVKEKITSQLQAAEAMIYKGSVSKASELLSKSNVEAGHTYVLTAIDSTISGGARPGDLFIAHIDNPTSLSDWDHVKTGYDASLEQKLSADASGIKLTYFDGKVDTVAIESTNNNIKVSVADNKISIGMEWGTF